MRILLTNDDGIEAPGLAALEEAVEHLGEVTVIAPHEPLSGCSHRATTHAPLSLTRVAPGRYMLDGTPADCARVALGHLDGEYDLVLSGVNAGGNLGCDVYLSGTVAAVREAVLLGTPGIALSQYCRNGQYDWQRTADWTRHVLGQLLERPRRPGAWLNVNLPDPATAELPEVVFCPLDANPLPVRFDEREGQLRYAGRYHERVRTPGSDVDVCFSDRIAVSELRLGG